MAIPSRYGMVFSTDSISQVSGEVTSLRGLPPCLDVTEQVDHVRAQANSSSADRGYNQSCQVRPASMSVRAVTSNHVPRWNLSEISRHFERPAISMSSQGTLHVYKPPSGGEYVVKFRPEAPKVEREISFLDGAGELAVDVISRIYDDLDRLVGFGRNTLSSTKYDK